MAANRFGSLSYADQLVRAPHRRRTVVSASGSAGACEWLVGYELRTRLSPATSSLGFSSRLRGPPISPKNKARPVGWTRAGEVWWAAVQHRRAAQKRSPPIQSLDTGPPPFRKGLLQPSRRAKSKVVVWPP